MILEINAAIIRNEAFLQVCYRSFSHFLLFLLIFSICQSMGQARFSQKFIGLAEMPASENPLDADSGLGCAAVSTSCFGLFSIAFFIWAGLPREDIRSGDPVHSRSDNCIGELFPADSSVGKRLVGGTVSTVFRRNTPCFAHSPGSRCQEYSSPGHCGALYKCLPETEGMSISSLTEKQRPLACPSLW